MKKAKLFNISLFTILVIEAVLCFWGPMPLVQRPSILTVLAAQELEQAGSEELRAKLEQNLAKSGAYKVKPLSLIESYLSNEAELQEKFNALADHEAYIALAKELKIELLAEIHPYANNSSPPTITSYNIAIYDSSNNEQVNQAYIRSAGFQDLLNNIDETGQEIDILKELDVNSNGIGADGWFLILFFITILVLIAATIFGKATLFLTEFSILFGLNLFLFDYIFALGADMNYVQRFIIEKGGINLSSSAAKEQLFAYIRYLPLLVLLLYNYFSLKLRFRPKKDWAWHKLLFLPQFIANWAIFGVLGAAILYTLTFPSAFNIRGIAVLAWLALIPLIWIILGNKYWRALLYTLAFFFFQIILVNYWHSTYDYMALPITLVALSIKNYLLIPIFIIIVKAGRRYAFISTALMWVLMEWLNSLGYMGYPWGLLGASQYRWLSLIQISDITGVWGVSAVVSLVSSYWAFASWELTQNKQLQILNFKMLFNSRYKIQNFIIVLSLVLGVLIYGHWRLQLDFSSGETVNISQIQQNTDPRNFDNLENFAAAARQTTESLREWNQNGIASPDLIVWPEGAVNFNIRARWQNLETYGREYNRLLADILDFQQATGTWFLTGSEDHKYILDEDTKTAKLEKRLEYNSSYLFTPAGTIAEIYHKIKLVPFTEWFPYERQLPQVAKLLNAYEAANWEPGVEKTVFATDKFNFASPICFEDIFPNHVREFVLNGAQIIINISNDYWSLTAVEGQQHGIHAIFRAVENRRPLTRTSTSGMTAYIDTYGRIVEEIPAFTESFLNSQVELSTDKLSFYTRFGDWFCWLIPLLIVLILVLERIPKLSSRRSKH